MPEQELIQMTESEALTLIHASPRIRHGEAAARMPRSSSCWATRKRASPLSM